jgi:hypothetical protein
MQARQRYGIFVWNEEVRNTQKFSTKQESTVLDEKKNLVYRLLSITFDLFCKEKLHKLSFFSAQKHDAEQSPP